MADKKQRDAFVKRVEAYLEGIGATVIKGYDGSYKWAVNTNVGDLMVHIDPPQSREKVWSIFTRFKDPNKASKKVECNRCSGKWNTHGWSADETFEIFKSRMHLVIE